MQSGCESEDGIAGLCFFTSGTIVKCSRYIDLLQEKLEPFLMVWKCDVLMHDGALCHRCIIVTTFLKTKEI